jgi:hypothetical protein
MGKTISLVVGQARLLVGQARLLVGLREPINRHSTVGTIAG